MQRSLGKTYLQLWRMECLLQQPAVSCSCTRLRLPCARTWNGPLDRSWISEPILSGPRNQLRPECSGPNCRGLASRARVPNWPHLRYEVTEEPSPGVDGARWSHTPELGIFHAVTDVHGNVMVSEDRIRYAYESGAGDPSAVYHELSLALGEAWDEELEPFRHAGEGAPVRWLHQVG